MNDKLKSELLDPETLRVGINLGNILLVTGSAKDGTPEGVAPDMATGLASQLGLNVSFLTYATPGEVADAAIRGEWDIGLIAIEPERAEVIDFCSPYCEIEATYLVPENSGIKRIEDVDKPGVRIAVSERAAYDLYLSRTLKHASLHRAPGLAGAVKLFEEERLDALAGLVPALKVNAETIPGSRLLAGNYTTVQQAIGTRPDHPELHAAAEAYIQKAKRSGIVTGLIQKHGVEGKLEVAGASP